MGAVSVTALNTTKVDRIVYFKMADFMLCKFYLRFLKKDVIGPFENKHHSKQCSHRVKVARQSAVPTFPLQVPGGLSQAPSFLRCWVLAGWHSSPPENASQRVRVPWSRCREPPADYPDSGASRSLPPQPGRPHPCHHPSAPGSPSTWLAGPPLSAPAMGLVARHASVHQVAAEAPRCGVPAHQPRQHLMSSADQEPRYWGHVSHERGRVLGPLCLTQGRLSSRHQPGRLKARVCPAKHHRAVLLQLTSHETHLPETACKAPPRFSNAPQAHSFPAGSLCLEGSLGFDFI